WGAQLRAEDTPSSSAQLAGAKSAASAREGKPTRIYADSFLVWIYARPQRDPAPIGYLRGGQSALLRSHEGPPPEQRVKRGCGQGWFAVKPAGFICLEHAASLTPTRYGESMTELAPRQGPYPF